MVALPAEKLTALVLMTRTADVVPGGIFVPGGVGTKLNPTVVADESRSAVTGMMPAVPFVNAVPASDPPSKRNATWVRKPAKLVEDWRAKAVAEAALFAIW